MGRPSSPWAQRFPLRDAIIVIGNEKHSLFAPKFPVVDPKYYDQDHLVFTNRDRPRTAEELDRLLLHKAYQTWALNGLMTWQIAPLNRYLRFSTQTGYISGGHRPVDRSPPLLGFMSWTFHGLIPRFTTNEEKDYTIYLQERITVDENEWLPFLRRDRWYDWIQATPFASPAHGAKRWSVDDPKAWEFTSVILELVNRILTSLIEDQHEAGIDRLSKLTPLQTTLYGRIDYFSHFQDIFGPAPGKDDLVLLIHRTELEISRRRGEPSCPWDEMTTKTREEWKTRLNRLLSDLKWGYGDSAGQNNSMAIHLAERGAGVDGNSIIVVGVAEVAQFLELDWTLSELCIMQVKTATTMIFGGATGTKPVTNRTWADVEFLDNLFSGLPLVYFHREWPYPFYKDGNYRAVPNSAFSQDGSITPFYFVPSLWASKILSQEFWESPDVPRKSDGLSDTHPMLGTQEIYDRATQRARRPGVAPAFTQRQTPPYHARVEYQRDRHQMPHLSLTSRVLVRRSHHSS
ncbi:hypothetical protein GGR57DRAFT_508796 [Xylariaceae sp. FL1272]|nr:hypothetical protein GGR57DRAFT_508796 [Xylariaceae sp. FL1272]